MSFIVRPIAIFRALVLPIVLILHTGFCCVMALLCTFIIRKRKVDTFWIRYWTGGMCWMAGMRIRITGLENIPPGGVLYVFNHQSLFDIPVVHWGIPKDFRFGAKIELFKIPIFGATMRALNALPIARGNRGEAIKVLEEAAKRMQNGESFVLAPEGTRQREARIGEFKSGPFIMAIAAKRPVVPVVIMNIQEILPKKALFIQTRKLFVDVRVKVLPAVDGAQFNHDSREEFKNQVRDAMEKAYNSR